MHPSKTQPCVVCEELPRALQRAISRQALVMEYYHPSQYDTADRLDAIFKRMDLEEAIEKHKRICNVHRVWIGGRG